MYNIKSNLGRKWKYMLELYWEPVKNLGSYSQFNFSELNIHSISETVSPLLNYRRNDVRADYSV